MSALSTGSYRPGIILCLVIFLAARSTHSAPVYDQDTTQVAEYDGGATGGCYYNFQHYQEGDRIITNEPCLNCTCHNRMLMCYLRVCPFSKAIGQDCTVEKRADQCCPVITCPEVPVQLLTSTTSAPATSDSTEIGFHDNYGCKIDDRFYADGAQLPTDPQNPCELCYCIRNRTTCVIQECTLRVAGCRPVYQPGVCCPVKYNCEYDEELETTVGPTPGLIMTTTIAPGAAPQCYYEGKVYEDGELIYSTQPCQHCYCFRGDIACAVQDCGTPMKTHGKNCTALPPPEGECCPTTYQCDDDGFGGVITLPEGMEQTSEISEMQPTVTEDTGEEIEGQRPTSETFPGADNAIPLELGTDVDTTEEPEKTVAPTEKPAETEQESEVSEPSFVTKEEHLPEEHVTKLAPVEVPEMGTETTEGVQVTEQQATEAPVIVEETQKPITFEQTEIPVTYEETERPTHIETPETTIVKEKPEETITAGEIEIPTATEKTEAPVSVKQTEAPITVEETEAPVLVEQTEAPASGERTEKPVSTEKAEIPVSAEKPEEPTKAEQTEAPILVAETTEPSEEGVQKTTKASVTEEISETSSTAGGLETEQGLSTEKQKIEQPLSTEESVTVQEEHTQSVMTEGSVKAEEPTQSTISEEQQTEISHEIEPSVETTSVRKPIEEPAKSTETSVPPEVSETSVAPEASEAPETSKAPDTAEGVVEKTTELVGQEEGTMKPADIAEQTTLKTEAHEIPQEGVTEETVTSKQPEETQTEEEILTEPAKPTEGDKLEEVKPIETTSIPEAQEPEQKYPSMETDEEQAPVKPTPELETKEKLPPLAPKKEDFIPTEEQMGHEPVVTEPHRVEEVTTAIPEQGPSQISESVPGYKAEDKESVPEVYVTEHIEVKKPEMHPPESLMTEAPGAIPQSEAPSLHEGEISTEHGVTETETVENVEGEHASTEILPGQEETSTAEITPTALETEASHIPELYTSTEPHVVHEDIEQTTKAEVPVEHSTETTRPEIQSTEKFAAGEELPAKGLGLEESGETSSEEVSSEVSGESEITIPGKEQSSEEEGEAGVTSSKPFPAETSTDLSTSEKELTTVFSSEEHIEEAVRASSEIPPVEGEPEMTQAEIQPTEGIIEEQPTTEGQVTVTETEQKESTDIPKVSEPSITHPTKETEEAETQAPHEDQTVKMSEVTAESEKGTTAPETVSEESTLKQEESVSTEEQMPEAHEVTESAIPKKESQQTAIPESQSTERVEIAEVQTSESTVSEEVPSVEEQTTQVPSLIESEHTPTSVYEEEKPTQESGEEEKVPEEPAKKEEPTEKTPVEVQPTEGGAIEEEPKQETEFPVTEKSAPTESSTLETKAEVSTVEFTEKVSEGEEQVTQGPILQVVTESSVTEEKQPEIPPEQHVTEALEEQKPTIVSIPEPTEISTESATVEGGVSEVSTPQESTEQPAVSKSSTEPHPSSESATELISGTESSVTETEIQTEPHTEEGKYAETEASITKELSTEVPVQHEESTSTETVPVEAISEDKRPEESPSTTVINEISESIPQSEALPKGPTETVESSTEGIQKPEVGGQTTDISTEEPSLEKKHELPSSTEMSIEVPSVKETLGPVEAEGEQHEMKPAMGEEEIAKPTEGQEEQSTVTPVKEGSPAVELSSSSPADIPTEGPIEHSTEQQFTDVTKLTPTVLPEKQEESKSTPAGIPGEGNCLVDGQSYNNNSAIPPANPCQLSCYCVSSIIQCELVQCPPPPAHLSNCMPVHTGGSSCCPVYTCDSTPTVELESDNHMIEQHTPKYEEGEKPEQTTLLPKVTETTSVVASEHVTEGEDQQHVPVQPETSGTVPEPTGETEKGEPPIDEQATVKAVEAVSEESTTVQEFEKPQEIPSREPSTSTSSEQSTVESTPLPTASEKTEEATEQEQEIVKLLPSTEEPSIEQATDEVTLSSTSEYEHGTEVVTATSALVTTEAETVVSTGEPGKIPEEGTETQQTVKSILPEEQTTEHAVTEQKTVTEVTTPIAHEIPTAPPEEQPEEAVITEAVTEVPVSTERGILVTEEEVTQGVETSVEPGVEEQTKVETEGTVEKEQPGQSEVPMVSTGIQPEQPVDTEGEKSTEVSIETSTAVQNLETPEEQKPVLTEQETVKPESEITEIVPTESSPEISTEAEVPVTEKQPVISETSSIALPSHEEESESDTESSQSTELPESAVSHTEEDKTIVETTESVQEHTEPFQPKDQTSIPELPEEAVVHKEGTPKPEVSAEPESSTSPKIESVEPSVTAESETSSSITEEHREATISSEGQTQSTSVEEHESIEKLPGTKEEEPTEVTPGTIETSEPIENESTEHSVAPAESSTPTTEEHVTIEFEEQTVKPKEEATKLSHAEGETTVSTSPLHEETSEPVVPQEEKTPESISGEEEKPAERTTERVEGETVGPSVIAEEQTSAPVVTEILAEGEQQQLEEEITHKLPEEEATTSADVAEVQPTLASTEKTEEHPGAEVTVGVEVSPTIATELERTPVTEQTEQTEEQKPQEKDHLHGGEQFTEIPESGVDEAITKASVVTPIESSTLQEKEHESSTSEQPLESSTPEEKPLESSTQEMPIIESSTPEEQVIETSMPEEKPIEVPTPEVKQEIESSTEEEQLIESSTPEEKPIEVFTPGDKPIEPFTPEENPIEHSTSEEQPLESSTPKVQVVESPTLEEKPVESSTVEEEAVETSTPQEKPLESTLAEEKPIESSTPEEKPDEIEQQTQEPITEQEATKPSMPEGETEKTTSEETMTEEMQTVFEEGVPKVSVEPSSTEAIQTEPVEEEKHGEVEEHTARPTEEEKSEVPETTESIVTKEHVPEEGAMVTEHEHLEEKATTVPAVHEEETQPTEPSVATKEPTPAEGEEVSPITKLNPTEVSSEAPAPEHSTTEHILEESTTKSEEPEKGGVTVTESTLPKDEHVSNSYSPVTEVPEEKLTISPVVTEEQEPEVSPAKPEGEQATTQISVEEHVTKLEPLPTQASIPETSEEIHEEGQEEVQQHVTEHETSSHVPQTDESVEEGQHPIIPDEEHIQPVNHTVESAEPERPPFEEQYPTTSSSVTPQGVEYPEQPVTGEDNPHFPMQGGSYLNPDEDYDEDDQAIYGPGTCRYGGKVYMSAQQIPRDDPCDFCFCFRSDIICLQQSCPPPIPGCHEEPISGFCCPRYECPVSMATSLNITTTTTTTTTTLPPHFLTHAYKGAAKRSGCQIRGQAYRVGEVIKSASGPCLHCTCGGDGNMKCDPRVCSPEPMLRQMIAAATARRRR